jgi:NAD(P)-dependent dehydrogenase (short-subunit alcohol dehydrogenase family)
MAKLLETTEEQIDKLTALQFKGPYFFLQTFCALMSQSGGGSIVTISSASVYALLYNHAAYIGTKAGTDALVRCFANEFGPRGVKINAIAPGLTATPMTERETKLPGLEEAFLREYPLGRIGTTDDVANAALWLVTDESFLTGQVLQVNGGLTLRRNPSPKEINASMRAASG